MMIPGPVIVSDNGPYTKWLKEQRIKLRLTYS